MKLPHGAAANPFNITKANDLDDIQIESLWVDVSDDEADTALLAAARPASPMPMFILGGKGSGHQKDTKSIKKIQYKLLS